MSRMLRKRCLALSASVIFWQVRMLDVNTMPRNLAEIPMVSTSFPRVHVRITNVDIVFECFQRHLRSSAKVNLNGAHSVIHRDPIHR